MDENKKQICCFFGHRKVRNAQKIKNSVYKEVEKLIVIKGVSIFLFGSKSEFNDLCYEVVSELKEKYPYIKRIYVRAVYAEIDGSYKNHLLSRYEDTYYPEKIQGAGKAVYAERNREMINKSDFCVIYYDEKYLPPRRKNGRRDLFDYQPKSGTAIAFDYAEKKNKEIINIFELVENYSEN